MAAGVTTVVGQKVGWALATVGKLTDIDTVLNSDVNINRNILGQISMDDAGNEYIYLLGVASTVAGSWVNYDNLFQTQLMTTGLGAAGTAATGPVAVALGAVLALQFGWYAIRHNFVFGLCVSDTFAVNSPVYTSATPGSVDDDTAAGETVYGAWNRTLGTTTSSNFQIMHPFKQGQSGA
jgi:hypothetical protein